MIEIIFIVEGRTDVETATKLAERVLVEKIDWLEPGLLPNLFQWCGLEDNTSYSVWKDIRSITERAKQSGVRLPKFLGHSKIGAKKADYAAAMKVLNLIRSLQKNRPIKAVLLIRDLDNQSERRMGLEQARSEHIKRQPPLEVVLGTADRMREAWVLNGFEPMNQDEKDNLDKIIAQLNFNPCQEAHRLRSTSNQEPDRQRNPKVVLDLLTDGDELRQKQCWEETSLEVLRERGVETGLTTYLQEVEDRLVHIVVAG